MKRRLVPILLVAALLVAFSTVAYARYRASTVLTVAAATATGTVTVPVLAGGHQLGNIGVRVAAAAGWTGTIIITPNLSDEDTGGTPTTIVVGDLTVDGAGIGVIDYDATGAYSVTITLSGNNKDVTFIALTFGDDGR